MKWKLLISRRNYQIALGIYVGIIAFLTLLPLNDSESAMNHTFVVHIRLDYLLHCLIYLPFVTVMMGTANRSGNPRLIPALIFGLVIATVSEGIQYWIPYRSYNINDLIANYMGITGGAIIPFTIPKSITGYSPAAVFKKKETL
jgi:VanZ family protein